MYRCSADMASVSRDDGRAANELLREDRRDYDGGIFLRHPQGITLDIFVDDRVADDAHLERADLVQGAGEIRNVQIVPFDEILRPDDRRVVDEFGLFAD